MPWTVVANLYNHVWSQQQQPHKERSHGHPIGIHCSLFEHIRASTGDQGARQLIKQYRDEIAYLDCDDPGVIQDIDQPSDLIKPS